MKVVNHSNIIHKYEVSYPRWIMKLLKLLKIELPIINAVTHFLHLEGGSVVKYTSTKRGMLTVDQIKQMQEHATENAIKLYNAIKDK